jgi:hypothetical protein
MDEYRDEHEDDGSVNDDPVLGASLVAELERVLGALDGSAGTVSVEWLLPLAGIDEMLALLREAPTGLGVAGFEQLLRARFGSLAALKRTSVDSGEADV